MKRLLFTALTVMFALSANAQEVNKEEAQRTQQQWFQQNNRPNNNRGNRFSPSEYWKKQRDFFTSRANLTDDEASKFFPLYNELQQKKMQINHQTRQQAMKPHGTQLTEEEATKFIDALAEAEIRIANLEKEYLQRFKEILPATKILKIQMAEDQFNSELIKEMQQRQAAPPSRR